MLKTLYSLAILITTVKSHVTLTFPPARALPLDFLDSARTISPCGVPKPVNGKKLNLYIGRTYNVTWRLQIPHQGGYRLVLLDSSEKVIEELDPSDDKRYTGLDDQGVQSALVVFRNACKDCTILLERQALEYGEKYIFHSCADVRIIPDEEECSESKSCSCKPYYTGNQCEQKNDCLSDQDCLNDGKCVDKSDPLFGRTCYCAFGYFGQHCQQSTAKKHNDSCFNYDYPEMKEKFHEHGIFDSKCYKKTSLNGNDFVYSRVKDGEVEIILDYLSTSWVALGWRPLEIHKSCRMFPVLDHFSNENQPLTTTNATAKSNGFVKSAFEAPLHSMDCTDIIVGSVIDGRSQINDMYTRDRSTPLIDTWLDCEESLTAAYGFQQGGRTIIMFRRRIAEIEPADHPLGPGKIFVIYAKGQQRGKYNNPAKTAYEMKKLKDPAVFKDDHFKYHGSENRGSTVMEFVKPDEMPVTRHHKPIKGEPDEKKTGFISVQLVPRKQTTTTLSPVTTTYNSSSDQAYTEDTTELNSSPKVKNLLSASFTLFCLIISYCL